MLFPPSPAAAGKILQGKVHNNVAFAPCHRLVGSPRLSWRQLGCFPTLLHSSPLPPGSIARHHLVAGDDAYHIDQAHRHFGELAGLGGKNSAGTETDRNVSGKAACVLKLRNVPSRVRPPPRANLLTPDHTNFVF